jgi:hypothetical protein
MDGIDWEQAKKDMARIHGDAAYRLRGMGVELPQDQRVKALEAERDWLRGKVDALREANERVNNTIIAAYDYVCAVREKAPAAVKVQLFDDLYRLLTIPSPPAGNRNSREARALRCLSGLSGHMSRGGDIAEWWCLMRGDVTALAAVPADARGEGADAEAEGGGVMAITLTDEQAALVLLALSESSTILWNIGENNPEAVDDIWPGAARSMRGAREHCEQAMRLFGMNPWQMSPVAAAILATKGGA